MHATSIHQLSLNAKAYPIYQFKSFKTSLIKIVGICNIHKYGIVSIPSHFEVLLTHINIFYVKLKFSMDPGENISSFKQRRQSRFMSFNLDYLDTDNEIIHGKYVQV